MATTSLHVVVYQSHRCLKILATHIDLNITATRARWLWIKLLSSYHSGFTPISADTGFPRHLEGCLGSLLDHISASSSTSSQQLQGPKVTLPYVSGKSEWRVFWFQFERMARRFQWNEEATLYHLYHLVSSLWDNALDHFAEEAAEVQASLPSLAASLERRFGDRTLPGTYCTNLQTLRKQGIPRRVCDSSA